jgi:hypothetical protein
MTNATRSLLEFAGLLLFIVGLCAGVVLLSVMFGG